VLKKINVGRLRDFSDRWDGVADEEAVAKVQKASGFFSWYMNGFTVQDHSVEENGPIKVNFLFKIDALNEKDKGTGVSIKGSATAWIDEYDNVEFRDVEAELIDT